MTERADHKTRFSADKQPVKNGRPKESRDRLSRAFLTAMADDFEANGVDAITKVRTEDPSTYVRVVASLQPKELEITNPMQSLTDDKLAEAIELLAAQIRDKAPPPPPDEDQPQHTVN